jgi:PAS domain S-box-containing protein
VAERECLDLIARHHGRARNTYAVTVRFAPASTPAQLAMAGALCRADPTLVMQTHVAENTDEVRWARELFPQARSYLDIYARAGLLHPRAVLAHGIWLDTEDRALLADTGAHIAHSPGSNLFLVVADNSRSLQLADRGAVDEFEVCWRAEGEPAWALLSARRLRYQGQDAVLTAFAPINHQKLMERRLELWAKVFEASNEGILIVDAEQRVLTANQALSRQTGYELQEVVGEAPALLLPGAPVGLWQVAAARGTWQGELAVRRRDGSEYPAWLMVSSVRQAHGSATTAQAPGEPSHYIVTSIDISDRKKSEQRIRFLADHDVLTELPNRSLCTERLRMAVQQAGRSGQKVAVMFIDLDRFKDINDSLGHHIGDGLLRSVAHRLLEAVRAGDTVVTYCWVGYRASATYFAARLLGLDAKFYDGSYQDWQRRKLPTRMSEAP